MSGFVICRAILLSVPVFLSLLAKHLRKALDRRVCSRSNRKSRSTELLSAITKCTNVVLRFRFM